MDTLWNCLAEDPECTDDCFHWFLNQAKSKDQHAMGLDTFKHIFMEKVLTRHFPSDWLINNYKYSAPNLSHDRFYLYLLYENSKIEPYMLSKLCCFLYILIHAEVSLFGISDATAEAREHEYDGVKPVYSTLSSCQAGEYIHGQSTTRGSGISCHNLYVWKMLNVCACLECSLFLKIVLLMFHLQKLNFVKH